MSPPSFLLSHPTPLSPGQNKQVVGPPTHHLHSLTHTHRIKLRFFSIPLLLLLLLLLFLLLQTHTHTHTQRFFSVVTSVLRIVQKEEEEEEEGDCYCLFFLRLGYFAIVSLLG